MYCSLAALEVVWVGATFKDVGRVHVHLDPAHAVLDVARLLPVVVHTSGHVATAELLVPGLLALCYQLLHVGTSSTYVSAEFFRLHSSDAGRAAH